MARYIDAVALEKKILGFIQRSSLTDEALLCCWDFVGTIKNQPTADVVEVKRGKWKKRTFIVFDNEIKDSYHCSECSTTWDTDTNFCPNCGANMRGDK